MTGVDEPAEPGWPHDHELLAAAAGVAAGAVTPHLFGPPVSPHLAAELAGIELDLDSIVVAASAAAAEAGASVLVVEGVGGLLVPLTARHSVRDLAVALGFPLVIAARPGLGTINHTLLTLEASRAAGLAVAGVVISPVAAAAERAAALQSRDGRPARRDRRRGAAAAGRRLTAIAGGRRCRAAARRVAGLAPAGIHSLTP